MQSMVTMMIVNEYQISRVLILMTFTFHAIPHRSKVPFE